MVEEMSFIAFFSDVGMVQNFDRFLMRSTISSGDHAGGGWFPETREVLEN